MDQLFQFWLGKLSDMVDGASRAVIFSAKSTQNSYMATHFWPAGNNESIIFEEAVKKVLLDKKCVLQQHRYNREETGETLDIVACPLFYKKQLTAVVVVEMTGRSTALRQEVIRQIQWAAKWFEAMFEQQGSYAKDRLVALVELVAIGLEHGHFKAAATEVVTELATRFSCDRVSLGFLRGSNVKIDAISHSADFDRQSGLNRNISECMHEAMDQGRTISYPAEKNATCITRNHAIFTSEHGLGSVCTVPFVHKGEIIGAFMFERPAESPFDQTALDQFEQISSIVGPMLEVRRRDERWLLQKNWDSWRKFWAELLGPRHLVWKLVLFTFVAGISYLAFATGQYRITATARLEAESQQVVVAPQAGYIARANARAGDVVRSGEELGVLDDKELQLEYQKWSSKQEQLRKQYRSALSLHDRSQVNIIGAQIQQTEAQINLINEQLMRTRLLAPFAGLVVNGDLSQSLGAPVERGQVLFSIAPMGEYRVILQVDERDIGAIKNNQSGHLVLTSMPTTPFPLEVKKVMPVSTAREGRNYYNIEASLNYHSDLLRPGMEGIAKVDIGPRKKIWIFTHKLLDWLRLRTWAYRP